MLTLNINTDLYANPAHPIHSPDYHLVLLNIIAIAAMTNTADYIGYLHTSSIIH